MERFSKLVLVLTALAVLVVGLPSATAAKRSPAKAVVKAYDTESGELTITTGSGRDITGLATGKTQLDCDEGGQGGDDTPAPSKPRTAQKGDGDQPSGGNDKPGGKGDGGDKRDRDECELTVGTKVRRALLGIDADGDAVWRKLKLDPPSA